MASILDEIPSTEQGIISYRNYAENQIKEYGIGIKRMDKLMAECERRLEIMRKGKKDG